MQVLNWESLAVVFMCDSSRKGKGARAMELHFQGSTRMPLYLLILILPGKT